MSESHKHLKITESEWDAFCKDFDDTKAKFNVPGAEHKELFAIVESTTGDIVLGSQRRRQVSARPTAAPTMSVSSASTSRLPWPSASCDVFWIIGKHRRSQQESATPRRRFKCGLLRKMQPIPF